VVVVCVGIVSFGGGASIGFADGDDDVAAVARVALVGLLLLHRLLLMLVLLLLPWLWLPLVVCLVLCGDEHCFRT